MPKNETTVVRTSTKKPLTQRQIAKKEQNIAAYEQRCLLIKQQQVASVAARKARLTAEQQEAAQQEAEVEYVHQALIGDKQYDLTRWLRGRVATYARVKLFFEEVHPAFLAKKQAESKVA